MTIIRAFLSVNFSIEVLRAISVALREARERCAAAGWDIAWVPPPNVHVLLRYLGEISVALPHPLVTAIRPNVEPLSPFPLRARGMRAITVEAKAPLEAPEGPAPEGAAGPEVAVAVATTTPAATTPATRIVVPIFDEAGGLDRLQAALATPLVELGFKPLEPRPVTEVVVARVVAAGPSPLEPLLAPAAALDFGSSLVTEVLLYRSTAHAPKGEFVRLGHASLLGHAPEPADPAQRAASGRSAAAAGAATFRVAVEPDPEPPEPDAEPLADAAADLAELHVVELAEPDDEEVLDDEAAADVCDEAADEPDGEEWPPPEA